METKNPYMYVDTTLIRAFCWQRFLSLKLSFPFQAVVNLWPQSFCQVPPGLAAETQVLSGPDMDFPGSYLWETGCSAEIILQRNASVLVHILKAHTFWKHHRLLNLKNNSFWTVDKICHKIIEFDIYVVLPKTTSTWNAILYIFNKLKTQTLKELNLPDT